MSEDQDPEEQFTPEAGEPSEDEAQMESSPEAEETSEAEAQMESSPEAEETSEAESQMGSDYPAPVKAESAADDLDGPLFGDEAPEEAPAEAEIPEVKRESRVGRFLKRALRWAVLLLLIFTLGVLAMHFVRVQPLREEASSLRQSLEAAELAQAELQADLERLEGVEAENEELSETLIAAEAKLALLDILVDVTQAQLALAQQDPARVSAALQGTGEKLTALRNLLRSSEAAELEALRERLVLVLSEVDSDPFAAERDLEILANTLLEIERNLPGQ